jgi:putative protease
MPAKAKAKAKKEVKKEEEEEVGKVTHFFSNLSVAIVKAGKAIKKGDTLHFKGATTDFTQKVGTMQVDHKDIEKAKKGDEFGTKVDDKVRDGDTVYLAK